MRAYYLCLGALVLTSAACKRQNEEIKVYKVAREPAEARPSPPAHGMMPGGAMPAVAPGADPHAGLTAEQLASAGGGMPAGPPFTDSPPANWKKQPLAPMRLASYLVTGDAGAIVDISFSTLRRAPGGLLANINRWRDQLGQPPIDEAAVKSSAQIVVTAFGEATVVDIEGLVPNADPAKDGRLIGAIAETGESAWFFKLRGNAALAATEKANFIQWIQSVKPAAESDPAATPVVAPTPPPAPAAGDGSLVWQLPAGWTLAPAGNSVRYATINVPGSDGTKGELAITRFPGDVGGDLDNVNRWRQQVSLPPVDPAGLTALVSKITAGPKTVSLIDVTGPQTRLVAGWTRHGADTWFFKFTGPDALVGAEKAKFTAFLESVRFTKPE